MTHRTGDGPLATVGERFDQSVTFTRDSIVAFATAVADFNPMHHDEVYAAGTRFGGLIASGTQTMSIFAAMVPTHFARAGSAKIGGVGLEFSFRLLEAVRVDDEIRFEWEVVSVTPKPKLAGEIVRLAGRALSPRGEPVMTAEGTVLLTTRL